MGDNILRGPDAPFNAFSGKDLINESDSGTRHPGRFEPTQSTQRQTQMDAVLSCQASRVAALSLATLTTVIWDTKSFDEKGVWNGGTSFTIPSTGKNTGPWLFHTKVTWPGTGVGTIRQVDILQTGVSIATMQGPISTMGQEISVLVYNPNIGTIYTVQVTHDAGGTLAMTVGSTNMFFEVHHPY